jgi:hypothetical protein
MFRVLSARVSWCSWGVAAVVVLTGCGSSAITAKDATQAFRQAVGQHYHGTAATGDRRGCVKTPTKRLFSCTAYIRPQGIDVIGTVTVTKDRDMRVSGQRVPRAVIRAWLAKTGGTKF